MKCSYCPERAVACVSADSTDGSNPGRHGYVILHCQRHRGLNARLFVGCLLVPVGLLCVAIYLGISTLFGLHP